MLTALPNYVIICYDEPETSTQTEAGILIPSDQFINYRNKGKNRKIDVSRRLDVVRKGVVTSSGDEEIEVGKIIFFNRHDADEIKFEDKTYYRLKSSLALAYEK